MAKSNDQGGRSQRAARERSGGDKADAESKRLAADAERKANWKRWGPYLAERQWATVREDYSADGGVWDHLSHDAARSRAYRWGEDGLLGICDRECRLCFALALWNGRDPILKERLFGLTGPQGNHGEDAKEHYFYLDSTPTHSYMKAMYRYPHAAYPYQRLIDGNAARSRHEQEFEINDTGVFDDGRFCDVIAEYAKADENDLHIRITVTNHGRPGDLPFFLHLLPTLWFRNTWIWGCAHEGCTLKPRIIREDESTLLSDHETLGKFRLEVGPSPDGRQPDLLFTENETNTQRLYHAAHYTTFFKDAFDRYVVRGETDAINPANRGTKAAAHHMLTLAPGESQTVCLRLSSAEGKRTRTFGERFDAVFGQRIAEAAEFYERVIPANLSDERRRIARQAYAGLLWTKQFYHYVVEDWLEGDPSMPKPPDARKGGRNADWKHVFARDVISMPDKWEYPWFAAWDLAFHMIPMAKIDPHFAKRQLRLLLREWYLHPNGQMPAYEFNFSDVNPPVHAWAVWRVYKMTGPRGQRDRTFLAGCFQKLLLNFTWWVNRKDPHGNHLFSGGFLGLDNIGVFDRSQPLPDGHTLHQADGTAWMAFYCGTMLAIALELAEDDVVYEDMASKFFEHFVAIVDAMNTLGGHGLWDEADGFYYDQLSSNSSTQTLRVRSWVGIIPLFATLVIDRSTIDRLKGFKKRTEWFLKYRADLARHITYLEPDKADNGVDHTMLAIPSRQRLERVLRYVLDEREFLSPYGIRSLSMHHAARPFVLDAGGAHQEVRYSPGESETGMFGGNSNWRGPIWFPLNYLFIEALQRYHYFFGDTFTIEYPTGSGRKVTLDHVARDIAARMARLFEPDAAGRRPCHGDDHRFATDPAWRDLLLYHEYFHADTGRGLGASHQTGWTALITRCLEQMAAVD